MEAEKAKQVARMFLDDVRKNYYRRDEQLQKLCNQNNVEYEEVLSLITPYVDAINYTLFKKALTHYRLNENGHLFCGIGSADSPPKDDDKPYIFIVHGRETDAKNDVLEFMKENGFEYILLEDQPNEGKTIIEKFEKYSDKSGHAVIIYTPCDKGRLNIDNELKDRARQNVVFEHGFFLARLGRKNISILVKGDVEIPSDIRGLVHIEMSSDGLWRNLLKKELQESRLKL